MLPVEVQEPDWAKQGGRRDNPVPANKTRVAVGTKRRKTRGMIEDEARKKAMVDKDEK